jgi:protein-tyrosine phosphatase
LAEAILNHKIKLRGYEDKISCDSCGTSDFHIGELPDDRTIDCATRYGIQMNHRGRQLQRSDFRDFDYVIAMDESNMTNILKLSDKVRIKPRNLYFMRDFQAAPEFKDVPDPYYGGIDGFEQVYRILDDALEGFLQKMEQEQPWNGKP